MSLCATKEARKELEDFVWKGYEHTLEGLCTMRGRDSTLIVKGVIDVSWLKISDRRKWSKQWKLSERCLSFERVECESNGIRG